MSTSQTDEEKDNYINYEMTTYTETELTSLTNNELKTLLEDSYGIINKYPIAKNPKSPIKAELILLIKELQLHKGDLVAVVAKYNKLDTAARKVEVKLPPKKKLTFKQRVIQKKKYLNALVRCIVTKKHSTQTFERGSKVIEYVTWGNTFIGVSTTRVVYDEIMLYPRGALQNLAAVPASVSKVDSNGKLYTETVPANHIEFLPQLTEEEIEVIAERQKYYEANR